MPNIPQNEQEMIKKNAGEVRNPGQLNYLITLSLIHWMSQHPKYETIHELYKDFVQDPKHNSMLQKLETEFADRFTIADIRTAASLAYHEFHRRIVSMYEDIKIELNGELPEYIALKEQLKALAPKVVAPPALTLEEEEKILDKELEGQA